MDIHPRNLDALLTLVKCWQADNDRFRETGRGPDGTTFPPKWPLPYEDTAALIVLLAERRAVPEPTVAGAAS